MLFVLKTCLRLVMVAGFLASGLAAAAQGYVYDLKGDVEATIGTGKPAKVKKNQHLVDNSIIKTGPQSNAVLKFVDGTVIVLNENTTFQIQQYAYDENKPSAIKALFSMLKGGLRSITGAIGKENREAFRVATPLATIGIRGTDFLLQLTNQLYVNVNVGAVGVTNSAGTATFAAGQTAAVANVGSLAAGIPAAPAGTFGSLLNIPVPPAVPGPIPAAAAGTAGAGPLVAVPGLGTAAAAAVAATAAIAGSNSTSSHSTTTHH